METTAKGLSLRRTILLPLIAINVLLVGALIFAIQASFEKRVSDELVTRSSIVANTVRVAAATLGSSTELHRFVSALGADPNIELIVVVTEKEGRVIATTRHIWLGRGLSDLPRTEVAEDIIPVLNSGVPSSAPHQSGKEYDYTLPLFLNKAGHAPERGVVMIHLNVARVRAELTQSLTVLGVVTCVGILAISLTCGYLLLTRVSRPLTSISHALSNNRDERLVFDLPSATPKEIHQVADRLSRAIEARRRLESSLKQVIENLDRQRFAVDQHAILAITDADGVITYANDRFCRISKYERNELIGQTHKLVNSGLHPMEFFANLWKTIKEGGVWQGEICNRAKDGSLYWVESTMLPLTLRDGKPTQFIAIRTDITHLKHLEKELNIAKDQAEASAVAKGEFLATMSHEIRTPMNGLIGFIDLLLECPLDDRAKGYGLTIRRSAESLLVLVNDILDFSKIEAGKLSIESLPVHPITLAREAAEVLATKAGEKGILLQLEVEAGCPSVIQSDPTRINQIILNLLNNSLKFTERGSVTIRLGPSSEAQRIRIEIQDTGIGIPADRVDQLFKRYSQAEKSTARNYGGTGLGLAICKSLVTLLGGEIGVESTIGKGSRFWIELPQGEAPDTTPAAATIETISIASIKNRISASSEPAPAAPPPAPVPAENTSASGLRVLIVDDNDANRILATALLAKLGVTSACAGNGIEAVELFTKERFDLVFMDCHMPVMDGCETTRHIRDYERPKSAHTPIIALSASLEDRDRCLASGMDSFQLKPVRKKEILNVLSEWFPGRLANS